MNLSERAKILVENAEKLDFLENKAGFILECFYNTRKSENYTDFPILRCEKLGFLEDISTRYVLALDLFLDKSWGFFLNEDAIDMEIFFTDEGILALEKEAESIIRSNVLFDILNKINRSPKKYDSLYLMQDSKNNELKIGRSQDVKSRRRSVSTIRGTKCNILFEIPKLGDHESYYHALFYKQNISGEWFSCSDLIINKFQELYKYYLLSEHRNPIGGL